MNQQHPFKWRHFQSDILLLCVRWYLRSSLSYRDLEEMMRERGLQVDHTTIYRWVQHYAPELEKRCKPHLRKCAKWRHLGAILRQSGQHQSRHSEIDKGLTTAVRALKIAREPTVARDPGVRAFDDPSSGKDMKALGNDLVPVHFHSCGSPDTTHACPRMFDNFEANSKVFFHPLLEFAFISAICPDQQETRQLS